MTNKKIKSEESTESSRKRKRLIPTRAAGTPANTIFQNPADDLFADAFANRNLELSKQNTSVSEAVKSVVNHKKDNWSTTKKSVVNNSTTEVAKPELFTTDLENSGKQKVMFTTDEKVVNHNKRNWSTTEKKRSEYGATTESYRTSHDFKRKIKVFCAEKGIDKQDFYRIVVNHYFDTVVNLNFVDVVNNSTYDDLMKDNLWKTKPDILNIYLQYNRIFNEKTRWTVKDDEAAKKFNDVDIRLVELGLIQTQANKNFTGKINSFAYYAPEIQNFIELSLPSEAIATMLEINRKRWQMATGKSL